MCLWEMSDLWCAVKQTLKESKLQHIALYLGGSLFRDQFMVSFSGIMGIPTGLHLHWKEPWIPVRRSPPLWWTGTAEAARRPVPALEAACKCTSTLSPQQKKRQQSTFHRAKSLLKTFVYKQGKKVVRGILNRCAQRPRPRTQSWLW